MDPSLFGPGLYKITYTENGKVYIGQSENIAKRLATHNDRLKKKKHIDCPAMQEDFTKYGKDKI